jgi:hypothetical protein
VRSMMPCLMLAGSGSLPVTQSIQPHEPILPKLASTAIRAATRPVHPQAQDHLERALGPWIWL